MVMVYDVLNLDNFIDEIISSVCGNNYSDPLIDLKIKSKIYDNLMANYNIKRVDSYLDDGLYIKIIFLIDNESHQILKKVSCSESGELRIYKLL